MNALEKETLNVGEKVNENEFWDGIREKKKIFQVG
jgi:hypothetical protein